MELIKLENVKRGDNFTECSMGCEVEYEATEDARRVEKKGRNGWDCVAKQIGGRPGWVFEKGEPVRFFQSVEASQYALQIYAANSGMSQEARSNELAP